MPEVHLVSQKYTNELTTLYYSLLLFFNFHLFYKKMTLAWVTSCLQVTVLMQHKA